MAAAGAVQVTFAGLSCLQVGGGSLPLASALALVRASALISALAVCAGFGLDGVMVGMLLPGELVALRPAQVPRPAAARTSAASAASQRGRRYQRGAGGRPAGGGAPA